MKPPAVPGVGLGPGPCPEACDHDEPGGVGLTQRDRSGKPWRRGLWITGFLAAGTWLWSSIFLQVQEGEATVVYPAFEVAAEPLVLTVTPNQMVRGNVQRGQSVFGLLSRYGLEPSAINQMVRAARPVTDLGRVATGQAYRVLLDKAGHFRTFEMDISDSRLVRVSVTPFGYVADEADIAYDIHPTILTGTASGSLFDDLLQEPGGVELARSLYDAFAWEIDFRHDIQPGDTYRVLVDEVWRDGRFEHYGAAHYVQVQLDGRTLEALDYKGEYYDPDGRPLRRTLLPAPVEYRYVSSRFTHARRHPVYGTIRPHYGVDFVAPYGTPVRAAGDGKVVFVGWKGDNGRLVSIRHNGVYRTVYAHMSRYARGLRRGDWVRQGQVIGYVGNSGSSTGTHLHYGLYVNGRPVDPLSLDYTPVATPVDIARANDFQIAWDQARLTVTRLEERAVALARM
jgi:murein DD-endopeptidase MepM/ murein hydrolase activator NlpD